MQDALPDKDDTLLKAVTGLEGGCVASGSTCGIVTGGALGIAQAYACAPTGAEYNQMAALHAAGEYANWFRNRYGTTQCGERHGVDFHTVYGQLRYFLSIPKILKCFSQAGHAINHLTFRTHRSPSPAESHWPSSGNSGDRHCASEVLRKVREKTGVGNDRLESLAHVYDGGTGLTGNLCGAVIGGVLALNLVHGLNPRQTGYLSVFNLFLVGHINLLTKRPLNKADTFFMGKQLVTTFRRNLGALECRRITDASFPDWNSFQNHLQASAVCSRAIELSAGLASEFIGKRPS
ncbi:MAG: C-GCAxxG-C-C family protein [Thermodesulfobacteriota bacterium]